MRTDEARVRRGLPLRRFPPQRPPSRYRFVIARVLWLFPTVAVVMVITFVLIHLAPDNPWDRATARAGRLRFSPATVRNLEAKYGLDDPWWTQLARYGANAVRLDFGNSYQYEGHQVRDLMLDRVPETAVIGVLAFGIIVLVGISLGLLAALRQRSWVDHAVTGVATVVASVPNFVVGILLILLFSVGLNHATGGRFYLPDGGFGLDAHLVLPVVTLSLLPTAFLARLARASTLEVLRQDHVRTARAKGVRERRVVVRHVLDNALAPLVTVLGPLFAYLISGSVVVETLFQIQGLGGSFVSAVAARDYPMILGTTIAFALVFSLANVAVDVAYAVLDPRVSVR